MAHIKPDQLRSGFYEITGSLYGTSSFAITASHVDKAVVTASAVNDTITFTKGDGSTFPVTLTSVATASYALNALSSSYAATASFISTLYSSNYTQSFTNQSTWVVTHNLDALYVIVQVYDTNFDEIIPQNIDLTNDDTVTITFPTLESGTAVVSVGGALQNNGSVSSSYALNATSASYALTASYVQNALTASYVLNAISASYALTASYVLNAQTASYVQTAQTASYVLNAQTASYVLNAVSASYALTASYVNLVAGPNITINQAGTAFQISSSGGGSVTVPGNNTEILFNSASALQASPYFKFNYNLGSLQQGNSTSVVGQYSHAEGANTISSGINSHAEGDLTRTWAESSHAEGYATQAYGLYSHVEGRISKTYGDYSHAEGNNTSTIGEYAHAEGDNTLASGSYSHAEGRTTLALGFWSHAEGQSTTSSGDFSHAEGLRTVSSGQGSHAEGYFTTSSGNYSHTEGNNTVASALYQHIQGTYNITSNITGAFIHGNGNSTTRSNLIFAAGNQVQITGSLIVTGSLTLSATQSSAPSYTGKDGEIVPATVGGQYFLYMWMNGAWRSGSFV
jgi:hypothetical protein